MDTSAKYKANWTETVGVVRTRFCGQTDRPPDRPTGLFQNTSHKHRLLGYKKAHFQVGPGPGT